MRPALEAARHQPTEHRVGADLDEGPDPGRVHGLDLLHEAHPSGDRGCELGPALLGARVRIGARVGPGVWRRAHVRVHRAARARPLDLGQGTLEGRDRAGDHRRVKGRRDTQGHDPKPSGAEGYLGALDRPARAREHDLLGAVVVGDHDLRVAVLGERDLDRLELPTDRDHRPRLARVSAGRSHELAPGPGHSHRSLEVEHAPGRQGRDLAQAVPTHGVGLHAHALEQGHQSQAGHGDRRLGPLRGRELGFPLGLVLGIEGRGREHACAQGLARLTALAQPQGRRPVPALADRGEGLDRGAGHAHVLAALTREQKCHAPDLARAAVVAGAPRRGEARRARGVGLDSREAGVDLSELGVQIGEVVGDHGEAVGRLGSETQLSLPGQVAQRCRGGLRVRSSSEFDAQAPTQGAHARAQLGEVGPVQQHQLAAQGSNPGRRRVGAPVLLQGRMEVGAAEPERAHARAPRLVAGVDPRSGLGVEVQGAAIWIELEPGVGRVDLDRRRQHLVVQRHHGLDEPSRARGRLGVTDLALDGPEGHAARGRLGLGEHGPRRLKLRQITGRGPGPVGLDQLDRARAVSRRSVGPSQGLHLPLGARRVDALGPAVGARADALEHRVDRVAIALRVGEALEGEHAHALAQQGAVGVVRERPAVAAEREGAGLAEAHVHEDVVEGVDAPSDHHVRAPGLELEHTHLHGGQRARASGIEDHVGPAQVQAAGDPPGHHVAEHPGEGALLPGDVAGQDPLAHRLDDRAVEARRAHRPDEARELEAPRHMTHELGRRGDPQDHADALARGAVEALAQGVLEHPLGDDQRQQLGRVGRRQGVRRHAEVHGRERNLPEVAAAGRVDLVLGPGLGVVEILGQPVGRGDIRDQVSARDDVVPKVLGRGRGGEQGSQANHGHRGHAGLIRRQIKHRKLVQRSGRGRKSKAAAGRSTPMLRTCWARVKTAAPSSKLRAI